MLDTNGKASLVIAGVWKNQKMEADTVNLVKSIYPLDDLVEHLGKYAKSGNLVITNENKATIILGSIGIQTAKQTRIISLAKDRITDSSENINTKSKNSSDIKG